MSDPPPPSISAGWYPDPENEHAQRWWDGSAWGPSVPLTQNVSGPVVRGNRPGRSKLAVAIVVGVLVVVAIIALVNGWQGSSSSNPAAGVEGTISADLAKRGFPGATVTCSNPQLKAQYQFVCQVSGANGIAAALVTVLNANGDITWRYTSQ